MKTGSIFLVAASLFALTASAADAAPLQFDFSGPSGTAVFVLDSNPTPDYTNSYSFLPGSDSFGFNNVDGIFGGTPGVASTINFGEGLFAALNIQAPGVGFTQFSGPTLFSGSFDAPVFSVGTFTLINPFLGNGTLTISNVEAAGAVPETASWAMMVFGFGLTGAMVRYRRRRTMQAYA